MNHAAKIVHKSPMSHSKDPAKRALAKKEDKQKQSLVNIYDEETR